MTEHGQVVQVFRAPKEVHGATRVNPLRSLMDKAFGASVGRQCRFIGRISGSDRSMSRFDGSGNDPPKAPMHSDGSHVQPVGEHVCALTADRSLRGASSRNAQERVPSTRPVKQVAVAETVASRPAQTEQGSVGHCGLALLRYQERAVRIHCIKASTSLRCASTVRCSGSR